MVETFRLSRQQDIVGRLVGYFLGHTGFVTDFSEGSIIRSLSEALAKELYSDNVSFSEGLAESIVTSIKQSFNFPLLQATKAYGNYTFYRKMLVSPMELNADQPAQNSGLTFIASSNGILPTNRFYYYGISGYITSTGSAASRESASTARLKINSISDASHPAASLRWGSEDGYSGYRIYRASVNPSLISTNIASYVGLQLSGSSSLLTAKTTSVFPVQNSYVGQYHFSVVSYEDNPLVVTTTPQTVGSVPVSISVGKTGLQCAEITFPGITSANYYRIFRSELGSPFDIQSKTIDRFKDQSLSTTSGSNTYYYSVTSDKVSAASSISSPPTIPMAVQVTSATQKTIQLKWLQVTDATGYTVYRAPTSSFETSARTTPITLSAPATPGFLSISSTGVGSLQAQKTYFYAVTSIVNSGENHEAESGISNILEQPIVTQLSTSLQVSRPSGSAAYRLYRWEKTTTNDLVVFQSGSGLRISKLYFEIGKTSIINLDTQSTEVSSTDTYRQYSVGSPYYSLWFVEQPYMISGVTYYNRSALIKLKFEGSTYTATMVDPGSGYHALPGSTEQLTLVNTTAMAGTSGAVRSLPTEVTINGQGNNYWPGDIAYVGTVASGTTRGTIQVTSVFLESLGSDVNPLGTTPSKEVISGVSYLTLSGLTLNEEKWISGNKIKITSSAASTGLDKTSLSSDASVYSLTNDGLGTYTLKISASTIFAGSVIRTISSGGTTVSDVRVSGPAFTVSVLTAGTYPSAVTTVPSSTQVLLNLSPLGGVSADIAAGGTIYDLRVNNIAGFSSHDVLTYSVGKELGQLCDSDQFAYVMAQDGSYSGVTTSAVLAPAVTIDSAKIDFTVSALGEITSVAIPAGNGGSSAVVGDIITVNKETAVMGETPGNLATLRVEAVSNGAVTSTSIVSKGSGYTRSAYSGITPGAAPTFVPTVTPILDTRYYKVTFSNAAGRESEATASVTVAYTGRMTWIIPAGADIDATHVYRSSLSDWTSATHLFSIPKRRTISQSIIVTLALGVATLTFSAGQTDNFTVGDVITVTYPTAANALLNPASGTTLTVATITDTTITISVGTGSTAGAISSISFEQRSMTVKAGILNPTGGGSTLTRSFIDDYSSPVETSNISSTLESGVGTTRPPTYRATTSSAAFLKVRSSRGGSQGIIYNARPASYVVPKNNLRYLRVSENILSGKINQAAFFGYISFDNAGSSSVLTVTDITTQDSTSNYFGTIAVGHKLSWTNSPTSAIYVIRQLSQTLEYGSPSGTISNVNIPQKRFDVTVADGTANGLYVNANGQTSFTAERNAGATTPGTPVNGIVTSKSGNTFTVQYTSITETPIPGTIQTIVCIYTSTLPGKLGTYVLGYAGSSYTGVVSATKFTTNTILSGVTYQSATPKPAVGDLLFHSTSTNLMSFASGEQSIMISTDSYVQNTYIVNRDSASVEEFTTGSIYVVSPWKYYSVLSTAAQQAITDDNSKYWVPMSSSEEYALSEKPVIIFRDNNMPSGQLGTLWPTRLFPMRNAIAGPPLNPDSSNNVLTEFYASTAQSTVWPYLERLNTIEKTTLTQVVNTNDFTYLDNGRQALDTTADYRSISTLPTTSNAQAITGSITIPYATQVGVPGTVKRYRTAETVVMSSVQNESLVRIESDITGDFGNTGANTITEIVTNVYGIAKGTNLGAVQYGYDPESETQWKMRFSSYLKKLARGTKESIQEGAKTTVLADSKGYVTEAVTSSLVSETINNIVDLYIHNGTSQEASASLISACDKIIAGYIDGTTGVIYPGYKAAGIPVSIKAAQFKLFNFDVQLTLYSGWSVATLSASVEGNIIKYINSLDIGDGFDIPVATASYEDVTVQSSEKNQYKVVLVDSMGSKSVASATLTTKARPVKITWTYPPTTTGPVVIGAEILKWSSEQNAWQLLATYYDAGDPATDYVWYKPKRTNTSLFFKGLLTLNGAVIGPGDFDDTLPTYRVGDRIEVTQEGGDGAVFTVDRVFANNALTDVAGAEGTIKRRALPSGSTLPIDQVPHNVSIKIGDGGTGYNSGAATTKLAPTYGSTQVQQRLYGIEGGFPFHWDPSPDYQSRQDFITGLSRYVSRNGKILVPQDYAFYNDGRKFFQISSLIREIMKTPGVGAVNVVATDESGNPYDVYVPNKGIVIRANTISIR